MKEKINYCSIKDCTNVAYYQAGNKFYCGIEEHKDIAFKRSKNISNNQQVKRERFKDDNVETRLYYNERRKDSNFR